ncbi:hypothetical protein SARC_06208 [Sphaeroforma arctica JP610]|uniref:Methyltransferase domain-containing protein n=1 Tax=Sphaeroforma arctica JP610 TaxID=667725 RepID=A0A0L0FXA7_9EUKA|nr:hypothetical protein SARC_06208 [Sphaeroforma arctica JP610]KNC81480.1 hypothetical protein SARC_06208 [Sphaeroforma arctica JP610]|eukprot:XP_014155382.1 hypothetical protein SARC_06208 [Sphaeroforma arctica JP610]
MDTPGGWSRRYERMVAQVPRQKQSNDDRGTHFFQGNWEPVIGCETMRKIGDISDSGKWICNPDNMKKTGEKVLIYSLGSRNEYDFEEDMYKFFEGNVEIHTFDFGEPRNTPHYVNYHQWGIGGEDVETERGTFKTLHTIMELLGHSDKVIDVFKMDIDGAECDALIPTIKNGWFNKINQLQMEIHLRGPKVPNSPNALEVHEMMMLLREHSHLEVFNKEPNTMHAGGCIEVAWVKVDWAQLAGLMPGFDMKKVYDRELYKF